MKIIQTGITKPPKVCIYGTHGVGKSTFAASCPAPIFIQTEDRLAHLRVKAFELSRTAEHVRQCLDWLLMEKHDYKTVVIDSIDWCDDLIVAEVCLQRGTDDINHPKIFPFGAGYKLVAKVWTNDILTRLAMLNEKGMMPVLISHFKVVYKEDPQYGTYQKYDIDLQDRSASKIHEFCDIVGFLEMKTAVTPRETYKGDNVATLQSLGQRALRLRPQPFWETKESYNLPASIDIPKDEPGWPMIAKAMKEGLKAKAVGGNLSEVKVDKDVKILTNEQKEVSENANAN